MHVGFFRYHAGEDLDAAIFQPKDTIARLYTRKNDVMLFFNDMTGVTIVTTPYDDGDDTFDVFVNGALSHTCMYKNRKHQGFIIHVFKEGSNIKIAQASNSICVSAVAEKSLKRKVKKKVDLRLKILKRSLLK